ncbi:hypothetical protein CMV_004856 [Castanea mollissima]|uniref:Uncharacterized protein n=1 Tax=Castanea mollissima TaxID=60419 RepID=A0A8J4RER0_9ROSI|nr:hypothetical protein CMV_004856 [Castanea mollissima]
MIGEVAALSEKWKQPQDMEAKKPARQNWDIIKAFGCCNCSTTPSLSQDWRIELGNHGIGISSFYSYFSTDSRSGREGTAAVSASMGGRSKLVGRKASDFSIARDGFRGEFSKVEIQKAFVMYIYIASFLQQYVAFSSDSSMEHKTRSGE